MRRRPETKSPAFTAFDDPRGTEPELTPEECKYFSAAKSPLKLMAFFLLRSRR